MKAGEGHEASDENDAIMHKKMQMACDECTNPTESRPFAAKARSSLNGKYFLLQISFLFVARESIQQ